MGQMQSKEKLMFNHVRSGNVEGIRALCLEGANLEWMDKEGNTPLSLACKKSKLYDVAQTLIELGANVNAHPPAPRDATPLYHAARRGLEKTVKLLLSNGANYDCQTPLQQARYYKYTKVVRAIENHICVFSGWMREFYGPALLGVFAPQLLSRRVWVVIVPTGSRNPAKPFKLELVVYASLQDAQPRTVMPLWKANLEEPKGKQSDTSVMIVDNSTKTRLKLAPSIEGDGQQLKWFCDACKGIPQPAHPPVFLQTAPSAPPLHPAMSDTPDINHHSIGEASSSSAPLPPTPPPSGKASTSGFNSHESVTVHEPSPSAPPLADEDMETVEEGPIHYPTIDSTPVDVPSPSSLPASTDGEKKDDGSSGQCSICLDAPSEAVCVPCGHVAGCMSCLTEIKAKKWGCPVCRAKIDQIIKLYRV